MECTFMSSLVQQAAGAQSYSRPLRDSIEHASELSHLRGKVAGSSSQRRYLPSTSGHPPV